MKNKLIIIFVILMWSAVLFVFNKDLIEYKKQLKAIDKQIGYHNIRISSQMNTLMSHHSKLEQIKEYLETNRNSYVTSTKSVSD